MHLLFVLWTIIISLLHVWKNKIVTNQKKKFMHLLCAILPVIVTIITMIQINDILYWYHNAAFQHHRFENL